MHPYLRIKGIESHIFEKLWVLIIDQIILMIDKPSALLICQVLQRVCLMKTIKWKSVEYGKLIEWLWIFSIRLTF